LVVVVVADIMDEFILGLDVMKGVGSISAVFDNGVLKLGNQEVFLITPDTDSSLKVNLVNLAGPIKGISTVVVEPSIQGHSNGLLIVRSVVNVNRKPIPVANVQDSKTTLKKGDVIGTCEPIVYLSSHLSSEKQLIQEEKGAVDESVVSALETSWSHLNEVEREKALQFVREQSETCS